MKKVKVTITMDSDLKAKGDMLFKELGMDMNAAVNVFVAQSVRQGGIPFDLSLDMPNECTDAALLESERLLNDQNAKSYTDLDELFADLKR